MSLNDIIAALSADFHSSLVPSVINVLVTISPLALSVILFLFAWKLWVNYVRSKNFLSLKYTVLELKLPKDVFKSPLAMETVLQALHNTADTSSYSQYWKGTTRPWYSLELISIEGQVKFMLWTEDARKAGAMNAFYSQFPGIEIYEREDYTKGIQFNPDKERIWAAEFIKSRTDKNGKSQDAYPIKTYVDFGLDKDPKEEYKIDPLAHIIEFLGGIKANQQIWIQIVIRAHKKEQRKKGTWFDKTDEWKDQGQQIVNEILIRDPKTKVAGTRDETTGFTKLPTISDGEQQIVKAVERSMTKLPFDVGIRTLYFSPKDTFDTPFGIGGLNSAFKQFNSESLNGFKSNQFHSQLKGVPWEDYKNMRRTKFAKLALYAYRRRSFFYDPFPSKTSVLNTEELATIFHFPSSTTAATPTLERVPSKKSTAPANLPL